MPSLLVLGLPGSLHALPPLSLFLESLARHPSQLPVCRYARCSGGYWHYPEAEHLYKVRDKTAADEMKGGHGRAEGKAKEMAMGGGGAWLHIDLSYSNTILADARHALEVRAANVSRSLRYGRVPLYHRPAGLGCTNHTWP